MGKMKNNYCYLFKDNKLYTHKTVFNFDHCLKVANILPKKNLDGKGYGHCKAKIPKPWRTYGYASHSEIFRHMVSVVFKEAVVYTLKGGTVKLSRSLLMKLIDISKDFDKLNSPFLEKEISYWQKRIGDMSKVNYSLMIPKIVKLNDHTKNRRNFDVIVSDSLFEDYKEDYIARLSKVPPKQIHINKIIWKVLKTYKNYCTQEVYRELISKVGQVVTLLSKGADFKFKSVNKDNNKRHHVYFSQYVTYRKERVRRGNYTAKVLYNHYKDYYEGKRKGTFYIGLTPGQVMSGMSKEVIKTNYKSYIEGTEGVFKLYRSITQARMDYFYILPIELDLDKAPVIELKRNGKLLSYLHYIGYIRYSEIKNKLKYGNFNEKTVGKYIQQGAGYRL